MTNPIVVIVGLLVGVLGAALIAGPTLVISDKEISRQKMSSPWWEEAQYFKKERRFGRLGVTIMVGGAFMQTVGALAL